jgi:hypothetical protein
MKKLSVIVTNFVYGVASVGPIAQLQVADGKGIVRPLPFSLNFESRDSWIQSDIACPVNMGCDAMVRESSSGEVAGELSLAFNSDVGRKNLISLTTDENKKLKIAVSKNGRVDSRMSDISYDLRPTDDWEFRAFPKFPKEKKSFGDGLSRLCDFKLNLGWMNHVLPWRYRNLFDGFVKDMRLYVNCDQFNESTGKSGQNIVLRKEEVGGKNGVTVYVRKTLEDIEPYITAHKKREPFLADDLKRFCPTNIMFWSKKFDGIIGRTVLLDNRVELDMAGNRIGFGPKDIARV